MGREGGKRRQRVHLTDIAPVEARGAGGGQLEIGGEAGRQALGRGKGKHRQKVCLTPVAPVEASGTRGAV